MRNRLGWIVGAGLLSAAILPSIPARAEHFDIYLSVRSRSGVAESGWDTDPPEGGLKERQTVTAAVGEELHLEWRLRSEFPHGTMKQVGIRLFAAEEPKLGQKELPRATVPRVFDNSFTADFLPQHSAQGHFYFRVPQPGNYLIRLQSENTAAEHGHEHFAAVDLKVE